MEKLLEAIKNNDLVEAKKAFASVMATKTATLIEQETVQFAQSIMIEGEEADEDEDDGESEDGEKKEKKEKDTEEE